MLKRIEVDAKALKTLLMTLNGPPYMIRELQVTRGGTNHGLDPNNPIDVLNKDYNDAVDEYNARAKETEDDSIEEKETS